MKKTSGGKRSFGDNGGNIAVNYPNIEVFEILPAEADRATDSGTPRTIRADVSGQGLCGRQCASCRGSEPNDAELISACQNALGTRSSGRGPDRLFKNEQAW